MVQINWIEREGSRKYLPFHLHQLQHYPFFATSIFYIHKSIVEWKHCFHSAVFSFMFHKEDEEMKKVLCIVYYTQKTFNFVFLDVRLIIAFQTCNREFLYEFLPFSHASTWLGLHMCARHIKSCLIFTLSLTTQYVICCFSTEQKTTWFIVFDWCTICVSFHWRMINLFKTWLC